MRIIATECLARRSTEGRSAGGVRPRNHPLTNEYTPRGAAEDPRFVYVALAASCIRIFCGYTNIPALVHSLANYPELGKFRHSTN